MPKCKSAVWLIGLMLVSACTAQKSTDAPQEKNITKELGEEITPATLGFENGKLRDYTAFDQCGEYELEVETKDGKSFPVHLVLKDTTKPEFVDLPEKVSFSAGEWPDYSSVRIQDASECSLEIDDAKVDYKAPGTYTAVLKATDLYGNEAEASLPIEITEAVSEYVSEPLAHPAADLFETEDFKAYAGITRSEQQQCLVAEAVSILKEQPDLKEVKKLSQTLAEPDWNDLALIDQQICNEMGWKYISILEGYPDADGTYSIYIRPDEITEAAKSRMATDSQISSLYEKAGIRNSDSETDKFKKISGLLLQNLEAVDDEVYPCDTLNPSSDQYKKAGCLSFALLNEALCEKVGIECRTIYGFAEGMPHAFNALILDQKPLYSDLAYESRLQNDPDTASIYRLSSALWQSHTLK